MWRLDVVDADQRHVQRQRQHLGRADADQQRADQARRVDARRRSRSRSSRTSGLPQRLVDDGQQPLQVGAGRDLGHDAAEARVQVGLRGDDVGEDGRLVGEDGGGGFVAGGFDGEEVCVPTSRPTAAGAARPHGGG